MFTEITMVDYTRTVSERLKSRKICGPYRWRPSNPGKGRGFYQASNYLGCDPRGSTFDLRIEKANDHLDSFSKLTSIDGYFVDEFQDDTLKPIIARLPRGRGFLAGWTMGEGMVADLDSHIWETAEDAARSAHDLAESDAEYERLCLCGEDQE